LIPFTLGLIIFYGSVLLITNSLCLLEYPRTSVGYRFAMFFSGYY